MNGHPILRDPSPTVDDPGDNSRPSIFGWSADNSGCEWYRIKLPLDALGKLGYRTSFSRLLTAERSDVLIGQRVANAAPSALWQALAASNRGLGPAALSQKYFDVPQWVHDVLAETAPRPKLIYELDDDLFDIDPSNTSAYQFFGNPEVAKRIRDNLCAADTVTVSTAPLAEVVRQHTDSPVHVVPNYLPDWLPDVGKQRWPASTAWPVTIGWAGGPSHRADIHECENAVRRFLLRLSGVTSGVELHTIGMEWPRMRPAWGRHSPWAKSVPEFYGLLDFDIGLAPLRPSVFNRSKSAIKVMEYGALGIAPIASEVGPYADYIKDGIDGLLVRSDWQWELALRMLTNDAGYRASVAREAWAKAVDNTIGKHVHEWEEVINAVVK